MPSYHIKKVIKDTSVKCAVAAVPGSFVPGIDILARWRLLGLYDE